MNKKIEALQKASAKKAEDAAKRVEVALEKMLREGMQINFRTVASVANVSTAYLYKEDELKERITILREQQKRSSKAKRPPTASDNSKNRIIETLREQNQKLRKEIEEFSKENDALAGRLYQLQEYHDIAQRLRVENQSLREQVRSLQQQLSECEANIPQKVVPFSKAKKTTISERIEQELKVVGVTLNQTLTKTIKDSDEETVLDAIFALKEAMETESIKRAGGWLRRAIEQGWKPNRSITNTTKAEKETFTEWFTLARKKGLVLASQNSKNGILVYTKEEEWIPFSEMYSKHPLATL
jgi:predicted RNase H-like nuclease (RuvC/YqgF family)